MGNRPRHVDWKDRVNLGLRFSMHCAKHKNVHAVCVHLLQVQDQELTDRNTKKRSLY